ncbi:MAG: GWxTD domain-containing protein [Ignavibacteriae bacterium]|nr:GWxTD domain-containing protein [Ignavibacteriota bacterium]
MKFKLYYLFIVFLINPILMLSQEQIGFDFDYAKFEYDDENSYLEIYYSLTQNTFALNKTDSGNFISANIKITLTNENNVKTLSENYNLKTSIDTTSSNYLNEDLVGILSYKIPHGKYNFEIIALDNYSQNNTKKINEVIELIPLEKNKIHISDIQLCSNIIHEDANPNSIYFKNSLETIPNPKSVYGSKLPVLFYYLEFYNKQKENFNDLKMKRIIYKNEKIQHSDEEKITLDNNSIVKAGFVKISKFSSGTYTLSVNIVDSQNHLLANSSKKFYVFNPGIKDDEKIESTILAGSEFDLMTEDECDYNFEISKYIAAKSEIQLYEKLSQIEAKRKFLFDFWRKRDIDPNTPSNEFKVKYLERLDYVNSDFSNKFREGYKTDRGRVVLMYGRPDRIDTFENESTIKPYEIWYYDNMEGGVLFVFGDTMGISDLELLHSTKMGELRNESWGDRISIYDTNQ